MSEWVIAVIGIACLVIAAALTPRAVRAWRAAREPIAENDTVDLATTPDQRLSKDSASIALMLVALGMGPNEAWTFALETQHRLTGRSYSDLLSLSELREIAELVRP